MKRSNIIVGFLITALLILPIMSVANAQQARRFKNPDYNGVRIDWCLTWAQNCGKPAADHFCRLMGYRHSNNFGIAHDIGYTRVLKTNQICNKPFCDGFSYIDCASQSGGSQPARRSYQECLSKYCPECAGAVSLLGVSADPKCETCKRNKASLINRCVSGK